MPPRDTRAPLTEREKALLERWIAQGAEWEPHWLYITPTRPELPIEPDGEGIRNPIDAFVAARLRQEHLEPSPQADPVTLARRLSFDLTGLPPNSDVVAAYLEKPDDAGYERLVDDLLASAHYGERMAVMWLDLIRYADTDGYHSDLHRNVSPFRDYVIHAFNTNKPFDRFTREQLAGDLLPHATTEQLVAAGYNRLGQATKEGGAMPRIHRPEEGAGSPCRAIADEERKPGGGADSTKTNYWENLKCTRLCETIIIGPQKS